MAALDLLGRRGALRVLWELNQAPLTFRALLAASDTNPSVLNARLKELRAAGIVAHSGEGYGLTEQGKALIAAIAPLSAWAAEWAAQLDSTSPTDLASVSAEHGD